MNCKRADRQMAAYLHGELTGGQAARLEEHLRVCAACRREHDVDRLLFGKVEESLRTPSDDLVASTMDAVRALSATEASVPASTRVVAPPRSRWAWLPRPAIAAAVVGIVAVTAAITLWLLRPGQPSVRPPIGTTPQVVQGDPGAVPPETTPSGPQEDSDEARDEAEPTGPTQPGTDVQPPGGREGAEGEPVPDKVRPDEAAPRSRRPRPRGDAWRPGQIARVTGHAATGDGRSPDVGPTERGSGSYGQVAWATGTAECRREGRTATLAKGDPLHAGDTLTTGESGALVAEFGDGSTVELTPNTELVVGPSSERVDRPTRLELVAGDIFAAIVPGGGPFDVKTPVAVAGVQGTTFALSANLDMTSVTVLQGKVELANDIGKVVVQASERATATLDHTPAEPKHLVVGDPWPPGLMPAEPKHLVVGDPWWPGLMPAGPKDLVVGDQWRPGFEDHVFWGLPAIGDGDDLAVDTQPRTRKEGQAARAALADSQERPDDIERLLGALWDGGGATQLSIAQARKLAASATGLTDLRRASLGVVLPLSKEPGVKGMPIFEVMDGSPAEAARLRNYDVIETIAGMPVDTEADCHDRLWQLGPNREAEVTFTRDGAQDTVTVSCGSAELTMRELALVGALRVLQAKPKSVPARIALANAEAVQGDLARAADRYRAILVEKPDHAVAVSNLAMVALVRGDIADAYAGLQRATRLEPLFERAWLNTVYLLGACGLKAASGMLLQRLADEHPDWERTHARWAWFVASHSPAGQYPTGELRRLADAYPENVTTLCALAGTLARAGDLDEAEEIARRSLEAGLIGDGYPARMTLAKCILPTDEAEATIEEMLRAWAPLRRPWTYSYASQAARGGKHGDALHHLIIPAQEHGVRLDPMNVSGGAVFIRQFLANSYRGHDRHEEALAHYLIVADQLPGRVSPWRGAARSAKDLGALDAARRYYVRALETAAEHPYSSVENQRLSLAIVPEAREVFDETVDAEATEDFEALCRRVGEVYQEVADEGMPELYPQLFEYYRDEELWDEAREAALDAIRHATPDSARGKLAEVAKYLAPQDADAALADLEVRLEATGGIAGPLGPAYVALAAAIDRWELIDDAAVQRVLDAKIPNLAFDMARGLSAAGRHDQAVALMDYAIRPPWQVPGGTNQREAWAVFEAAGRSDELPPIYESYATDNPTRPYVGLWAADIWAMAENWPKYREWLERALDNGAGGWGHIIMAQTHLGEGAFEPARTQYRLAAEQPSDPMVLRRAKHDLAGLDALGVAEEPLSTLCGWSGKVLGASPGARAVPMAAMDSARAGRHVWVLADGLTKVAGTHPQQVVEWSERLVGEYPDDPGAVLVMVAMSTREYLDDPTDVVGFALAALDVAEDRWEPEMLPKVYVSLGLALLEADEGELAGDALLLAMAHEAITDSWREMAGGGLAEVAWYLAPPDADAALANVEVRLEATGGIAGPLGPAYVALAAATDRWERIDDAAVQRVLDADSPDLALELALRLSAAGRHDQAVALMDYLEATGGIAGPLGPAYVELVAATDRWELIDDAAVQRVLDANNPHLAFELALALSAAGRHDQAVPLMDYAIRAPWQGRTTPEGAWEVFDAAGRSDELPAIYESYATDNPWDGWAAFWAADIWARAENWPKYREWLQRAIDEGAGGWARRRMALVHLGEGAFDRARTQYRLAAKPTSEPGAVATAEQALAGLDALGAAEEPLSTLCGWSSKVLGIWGAAVAVPTTAMESASAGRHVWVLADGLTKVAGTHPQQVVEWSERLVGEYPDDPGAVLAMVAMSTREYLDDPTDVVGFALAALDVAEDRWEPEMLPKVYVSLGLALLEADEGELAGDAFLLALAHEAITDSWREMARGGLASLDGMTPAEPCEE